MSWTNPMTWTAAMTVDDADMNVQIRDNMLVLAMFSRGHIHFLAGGIGAGVNIIVWYAIYPCTVTNVRGYRVGGTGATINARRNGTFNHLASHLSLISANAWIDGGAVQNEVYDAGHKMEIMIVTVAGSPTQVAVQVDLVLS